MKKILITGSSGRIGKDLKNFLSRYYKIIGLEKNDKLSPGKFKGMCAVIHLAALTPKKDKKFKLEEYIKVNAELTKKILSLASECHVKLVIIPTSWSWMFKVGYYQYSKLIQEKIANKYKELGLNVVLVELPEVMDSDYGGVISSIVKNIESNHQTIVDRTNITTITTKDIASVFIKFIEGNNTEASALYRKSLETFDLYVYIKKIVKDNHPDKLKYLIKGKNKITAPLIKKNKTIIFPDFKIEV